MKTINYNGRNIELTAIKFVYDDETSVQEGVLLHDTTDEFSNGDTIYGCGWRLSMINDAYDVDCLIASNEGTSYATIDVNGVYHIN